VAIGKVPATTVHHFARNARASTAGTAVAR
jgi:hypothetical protein